MKKILSIILIFLFIISICPAEELSKTEKYNLLKKDPTWPMVSSGLIGFGSGQFMAGDTNKGVVFALVDTAVFLGTWAILAYSKPENAGLRLLTAAVVGIGSHVWQVVDTYQEIENQNMKLRKEINIE